MRAVASVVLNRVAHPQFPDTVCAVVTQGGEDPPCQFSWWCDGKSDRPTEPHAWRLAQQIAQGRPGQARRPIGPAAPCSSTTPRIATPWLRKRERTVQIGTPHLLSLSRYCAARARWLSSNRTALVRPASTPA